MRMNVCEIVKVFHHRTLVHLQLEDDLDDNDR